MNEWLNRCHFGDCIETLRRMPGGIVQTCVTSPPYFGLRDYGHDGQIGLEPTPDAYVAKLVEVFREVRRVMRDDGTLWLNLGDSYANGCVGRRDADSLPTPKGGHKEAADPGYYAARGTPPGLKPKDLIGIPWRVAFALQADGWYLRQDIIWAKPNPMPESVQGSHYSRHTVSIEEYENLSGLPYVDERAGDAWAGDMPSLQEREIFSSKALLSAKSQGTGYGKGKRVTGGCAPEAQGVQSVAAGAGQQGEIRADGERLDNQEGRDRAVQAHAEIKEDAGSPTSENEGHTGAHSPATEGGRVVHPKPQGEGAVQAAARTTQGRNSLDDEPVDSGGLGRDCGSQPGSVPLLWTVEEADAGSCDPFEQGRPAHERERRAGVPAVQLQKAGQDTDLVGCPGCHKCIQHHGYIFHLSAGRCTKAHEYIFLLSKSATYYYDAGSILEPVAGSQVGRVRADPVGGKSHVERGQHSKGGIYGTRNASRDSRAQADAFAALGGCDGRMGIEQAGGGLPVLERRRDEVSPSDEVSEPGESRNKRSVWTVASEPYSGAHFATFPRKLIEPCILAGAPVGGVVLDPFLGSGTTAQVAQALGRQWIGCELNLAYEQMQRERVAQTSFLLEAA